DDVAENDFGSAAGGCPTEKYAGTKCSIAATAGDRKEISIGCHVPGCALLRGNLVYHPRICGVSIIAPIADVGIAWDGAARHQGCRDRIAKRRRSGAGNQQQGGEKT